MPAGDSVVHFSTVFGHVNACRLPAVCKREFNLCGPSLLTAVLAESEARDPRAAGTLASTACRAGSAPWCPWHLWYR